MSPYCAYKRCERMGKHNIDLGMMFNHPYVCDKHFIKIAKQLGVDSINIESELKRREKRSVRGDL